MDSSVFNSGTLGTNWEVSPAEAVSLITLTISETNILILKFENYQLERDIDRGVRTIFWKSTGSLHT